MIKQGMLDEVIADFKIAKSFVEDEVRFGKKYIFRNKDSRIIKYSDISEVEYVNTTSSNSETMANVYYLSVSLKSGITRPLYGEKDEHDLEAKEMIDLILKYNPDVKVIG